MARVAPKPSQVHGLSAGKPWGPRLRTHAAASRDPKARRTPTLDPASEMRLRVTGSGVAPRAPTFLS